MNVQPIVPVSKKKKEKKKKKRKVSANDMNI